MILDKHEVPEFHLPPEDFYFLASENHIYDYASLYSFTNRLHDELKDYTFSVNKPLLIISDSSDELAFLIAGAFLLKIPFFILHPDSSDLDIRQALESVDPPIYYSDQPKRFSRMIGKPHLAITQDWLSDEAPANPTLFSLDKPELVTGLFLTSGSTSTPKIVPIKRRQIFYAAHSSAQNFKPQKNHYWLLCLPLNHIGGISVILRSILYHSAIFRMNRFELDGVRTFLSENRLFEVASLVPTMLSRILEDPVFQIHSGFKAILLGGGPISPVLINNAVMRGVPIVSSYGMTETCAQIAANAMLNPSGTYPPKASVGTVFPPNQIQIRDDDGKPLPPIEKGRIWLKGPQVFDGYLNKKLNKDMFDSDGWFNTGDYGHLNRNRHLFIENRRSDLIITGGENVNPLHVELVLNRYDEISESAVIGIPDPNWGQRVVAYIVLNNQFFNTKKLRTELKQQLRGFQIPKEFIEVEELPKTPLGKIKRNELIRIYEQTGR